MRRTRTPALPARARARVAGRRRPGSGEPLAVEGLDGITVRETRDAQTYSVALRAELGPLGWVWQLSRFAGLVDGALVVSVAQCRAEGDSWREIGEALGMSGQAARERFAGRLVDLEHALDRG